MAIFRKIQTTYWSDSFISELEADKKLFYIYLLTNERTTQCGIYEITKRQISFDLGYSIDTVTELLKFFEIHNKIRYSAETNEIMILNWIKYNDNTSPKVKSLVDKELKLIKNKDLIQYRYSIDTVSILNRQEEEEQEEEKEQKQEREKEQISPSPDFLNSKKPLKDTFTEMANDTQWIEKIQKHYDLKTDTAVKNKLQVFFKHLDVRDKKYKSIEDAKEHFCNLMDMKKI